DPLETVLAELRGDSLFASRRMVEVMGADAFLRTHGDAIVRYLERPSATGVLVLDAAKVDGRTRLPGAVRAAGMIVDCPTVYEERLPGWVKSEVRRRGLDVSTAVVSVLIDEVGNNLFALAGEIDKLVTYVGDRKRIEADDVARITGHARSWVVWTLTDALGRRDVASALRVLEGLLREGDRAELIVGSLNWQISRLMKGRMLRDRGSDRREIASQLRVGARYVDAVMEQIDHFAVADLARVSRLLLEADVTMKSSGMEARTVLERFLVEACRDVSPDGDSSGT
ncbi:MAG TPA: DNA polymerase III subunit delta, partial [Planctomycetota bacterium]|nr:DNA polymerase III subunit delta [Planctomycetota bacterium]